MTSKAKEVYIRALQKEVLQYQKEAHDSNVTAITAIQLLREVWSDHMKQANISAIHLEEIGKFLRFEDRIF